MITNVEKPCFHALLIQYHGYKLLLLTYAVLHILVSPELDAATRINRLREVTWGRQLIISAETVLVEFVRFGEQPYAFSLSHAPDHLFNLVCFATLLLIKTRHMHGTTQPYPLPTLPPLVERVTGFFKKLALTDDHLPMRCATLIETLMKAYERIKGGQPGCLSLGESGDTERPSRNDERERVQPGPTPQLHVPASASHPSSAAVNTDSQTYEPNSAHGFYLDGMANLDQMGGIEMFFGQSIWPESVLSGLVGESDSRGVASFDFGNFFGLYDTQPQF